MLPYFQVILDAISHVDIMKVVKEKKKKPREMTSDDRKWCLREEQRRNDIIKANSKEIDSIMNVLIYNVTSRTITGRHLIMKFCVYRLQEAPGQLCLH